MADQETEVSHHQLFKDLLRAFFREFMELFYPDEAARLDFTRAVTRDTKFFTDIPQGNERQLDLVTEIPTREGTPDLRCAIAGGVGNRGRKRRSSV